MLGTFFVMLGGTQTSFRDFVKFLNFKIFLAHLVKREK